jgi:hypothetical protein
MLKSLAVVTVLVFFAIGVSGQPNQTSKDKSAIPDNHHPAAVSNDSQEAAAKSNDEPFRWNTAIKRPEWWAIGIALATLGLIFWQAKETRKAAKAALLQANHISASERAWLVISSANREDQTIPPSTSAVPLYWWKVKNVGSTPAKIIETQAVCKFGLDKLPEKPNFPLPVELNGRLLAPGDSMEFHTYWSDDNGEICKAPLNHHETMNFSLRLVAYGYVKYEIMLDPDVHESRFCDDCIYSLGPPVPPKFERYVFRPNLAAPTAYSQST